MKKVTESKRISFSEDIKTDNIVRTYDIDILFVDNKLDDICIGRNSNGYRIVNIQKCEIDMIQKVLDKARELEKESI